MTSSPLTLEFAVPLGNLIILVSPCTFLSYPLSSPIHIPGTPLCSCYPLYIPPVLPCLPVSSPVHKPSPQVFSCRPLHMPLSPLLSPSSTVWSLPAQWSLWCLLYTRVMLSKIMKLKLSTKNAYNKSNIFVNVCNHYSIFSIIGKILKSKKKSNVKLSSCTCKKKNQKARTLSPSCSLLIFLSLDWFH